MLNQLLSGHTLLNQHRARIDNSVSEMCPVCSVREDPDHFLFDCKAYEEERSILVEKVESIINSEGLNSVGVINLKVLNGNIDDLSSQGKNEILGALLQYIKCTNSPGGVLRYFHTYIGSAHFFGFKIMNFNIFWGFQKNEYFFGV